MSDGGTSVEDARPVDRPGWWRRRLIWWIAGGAALLVIVGVVGFALARPHSPATVVRGYLEALSRGDLAAAVAVARPDAPIKGRTTFLDRAALRTGWKVRDVTELGNSDDSSARMKVQTSISGIGGISHGTIAVVKEGDSWRIPQPYLRASFADSPLGYVDVNGKIAPRVTDENQDGSTSDDDPAIYALHPGDYRLYGTSSPSFQVTAKPRTLLPVFGDEEEIKQKISISAAVKITPAGLAKIQQAVRARVDHCAKGTDLNEVGDDSGTDSANDAGNDSAECPFGLRKNEYENQVRTPSGAVDIAPSTPVQWRVVRYPTVAIAPDPSDHSGGRGRVITTGAGAVTLTGMGQSADYRIVSFTATCPIAEPYDVSFARDGTPTAIADLLNDRREHPC